MKTRVIVVDDDPSILELLSALLEGEGYQVQTFDLASDALADAQSQPPSVAVVDLVMPGMTGKDLVQALRHYPGTSQVPILICSAYYGDLRHAVEEFGLEDVTYLRKPFYIEQFLELVAQMAANHDRHGVGAEEASLEPAGLSGK